jgi:hypothetical protein
LIAKKVVSLDHGLRTRRHDPDNGLQPMDGGMRLGIAFGELPGADPTPGVMDGHGAWANNLRIPEMALKCVHFASAHEMRNSFPLDSVREGLIRRAMPKSFGHLAFIQMLAADTALQKAVEVPCQKMRSV